MATFLEFKCFNLFKNLYKRLQFASAVHCINKQIAKMNIVEIQKDWILRQKICRESLEIYFVFRMLSTQTENYYLFYVIFVLQQHTLIICLDVHIWNIISLLLMKTVKFYTSFSPAQKISFLSHRLFSFKSINPNHSFGGAQQAFSTTPFCWPCIQSCTTQSCPHKWIVLVQFCCKFERVQLQLYTRTFWFKYHKAFFFFCKFASHGKNSKLK